MAGPAGVAAVARDVAAKVVQMVLPTAATAARGPGTHRLDVARVRHGGLGRDLWPYQGVTTVTTLVKRHWECGDGMMVRRAARPTRPRLRLVNAFTGWILHTAWLRRLAEHQVVELRYTAFTGRPVALPVMYAQRGEVLVVLVGGPEGKRWWRHFRRPQPVRVLLRGATRSGIARVVDRAAADRRGVEEIYAARFADIPVRDDPLVVINLDPVARS